MSKDIMPIKKSKLKKMYMIKIDYRNTRCPVCNEKGDYIQEDYYLLCEKCGALINTPYSYTAGVKYNRGTAFSKKIIYPMEDEEK